MRYTNEEKQIAQNFIDCKIPNCIKNNEFCLEYDSMEYYEALFDFAHCILNDLEFTSAFSNSLEDESFNALMNLIKDCHCEHTFYIKAKSLFHIVEKRKNG